MEIGSYIVVGERVMDRKRTEREKEGRIVIIVCFVYIDELPGTASSSYEY